MGGLRKDLPFTFWMMVIGTLALTGFPFTAGYYSKDAIIEAAYRASSGSAAAVYGFLLTTIAAGLTSFYSWRLIFMTFFGQRRLVSGDEHDAPAAESADAAARHDQGQSARAEGFETAHAERPAHGGGSGAVADPHPGSSHGHAHAEDHDAHGHGHAHAPHEPAIVMLIPLGALALGALAAGFVFDRFFIGEGSHDFWRNALYLAGGRPEEIPAWAAFGPTVLMVVGFLVALLMYIVYPGSAEALARTNPILYRFLLNKWYFDEIYDALLVRPAFKIGRLFWRGGDGKIIDGLGPDGVAARVRDVTAQVVRLQTGYLYHYAFAMLIGVAALITWYVMSGAR